MGDLVRFPGAPVTERDDRYDDAAERRSASVADCRADETDGVVISETTAALLLAAFNELRRRSAMRPVGRRGAIAYARAIDECARAEQRLAATGVD
jgi:hypothetical protein